MNSELFELKKLRYFLKRRNKRIHTFRERPNHFDAWNDAEFLKRFRLSKKSAIMVLDKIKPNLTYKVERYNFIYRY